MNLLRDVSIWFIFVFVGLLVGGVVSVVVELNQGRSSPREKQESPPDRDGGTEHLPFPHQVPQNNYYRDGLSLRFSMVHDVVFERYPRHSDAWYRRRNERDRRTIEQKKDRLEQSDHLQHEVFESYDNLAVGLDRLGRSARAVEVLREKKELQRTVGRSGQDLYTTHANLSTHLIHAHFQDALKGDADAKEKVREALGYLRQAIDQKLGTYFNREPWQETAVQFFLAASEDPELLLRFDFVGNRLSEEVDPAAGTPLRKKRGYVNQLHGMSIEEINNPSSEVRRDELRSYIKRIQRPADYLELFDEKPRRAVPFDEPVLAIIGMWRLGGGPNPHFSLSLAETMLRVGERKIAWNAFERAVRMGDRFWHTPDIREKLIEHCRNRQRLIEQSLSTSRERLKEGYESEWDSAMAWRSAYQAYERKQLDAGRSIEIDDFHEPFYDEHDRIASSPGRKDWFKPEETVNFYRSSRSEPYDRNIKFSPSIGIILLVTGLFGLLGGVFVYVNDFSSSE